MRVFTHCYKKGDNKYRWRTILQIGDSWEKCGTIFMKNPGSSNNKNPEEQSIDDMSVLEHLREFDDTKELLSSKWYEFTKDSTMDCVKKLFEEYYNAQGESLNGVIQIFNLFNIRDKNLSDAIKKLRRNISDDFIFSTKYDIDHIVPPVYIGWGNLWKNPTLRKNAEEIFNAVKNNNSYLCDGIQNNKFYHPLYLMVYGKNREKCKEEMNRFKKIKL